MDKNELFDYLFKYKLNESLRHKGDKKQIGADMGVLVIARVIIEKDLDEIGRVYERHYHCRLVKWSGSGEIAQFSEKELISEEEWEKQKVRDDAFRDEAHENSKRQLKEVYKAFGVSKDGQVKAKDDGEIYDVTGCGIEGDIAHLHTRQPFTNVDGKMCGKQRKFTSAEDFEVIELKK